MRLKTLWETEELDSPKYETMYSNINGQHTPHYSFHHICSNNPFSIRDEVDGLRKEFNKRIKRVVCQSTFIAYYSCFIPWCFVQVSDFFMTYNTFRDVEKLFKNICLLFFRDMLAMTFGGSHNILYYHG